MKNNYQIAEEQANNMFPKGSKNWQIAYECILDSLNSESINGEYIHKYEEDRMYSLDELKKAFYRGKLHLYSKEDEKAFDEFLKTL